VTLMPFKLGEPAYISVDRLSSSVSTSAGDAQSDKSASPRGDGSVLGSVWSLSMDQEGSRRVQDALDQASSDEARQALVEELHGLAVRAMRHPHANHVLQKIISLSPPASLQFMVDELVSRDNWVGTIAKHRYGGRIVQQLLKKCSPSQVTEMAETLLQDVVALSCHAFGTFSVQHLLRFGTQGQRHRLAIEIAGGVVKLAACPTGCGVIATAMEHVATEDQVMIARSTACNQGLLLALSSIRHGNIAVLNMVKVLSGDELIQAYVSLVMDISELRTTRYGRVVAKHLEEQGLVSRPQAHPQQPASSDEAL